jgi:single-strand DNA-binding protein
VKEWKPAAEAPRRHFQGGSVADFNEIFIEGRIVDDATSTRMPNGTSVVTFYIACNEDKKVNGEWIKHAQFVEVYIYGGYADSLFPSLMKSSKVIVRGRIEQQKWESRDGERQNRIVVVANKVRVLGNGRREE